MPVWTFYSFIQHFASLSERLVFEKPSLNNQNTDTMIEKDEPLPSAQMAQNVRVFMQYGYLKLVCQMPELKMNKEMKIN